MTGAAPAVASNLFGVGGLTITGAGSWTLVAVVVVALIRAWPVLRKLKNESDENERGDQRKSEDSLRDRVVSLERRIDDISAKAHQVEMKLVSSLAAYRLVASELARIEPNNPILKQAQELLNVSYPSPRTVETPADTVRNGKAGR